MNNTLVFHWSGKTWARVPSANPGTPIGGSVLTSIAAWSSSNVWAVGDYDAGTRVAALAFHCC